MSSMDTPAADGRSPYRPHSRRRILCVYPRCSPSFGSFDHSFRFMPGVRAFMVPRGLLLVAAYLPQEWEVRFVDENLRPVRDADYRWADVVLASGMHVQREQLRRINEEAHRWGKLTVLGGPSVSACPEYYPEYDLLHVGELGDATDALIAHLDGSVGRPERQVVFRTERRLPMDQFPMPAYDLVPLSRYLVTTIQYSSGCAYHCDFCDVPALYGRSPRVRTPEQLLAELDAIVDHGVHGTIYFVDDNFIGHAQATKALLSRLIEWQRSRGYPVDFTCEATLTLAQKPELLEMMREAAFSVVFCGIESLDPAALRGVHKEHNLRAPILDSVRTLNSYGLEVAAGIILGFDSDTPETVEQVIRFVEESQIPMLTINLLYALPRTPLYDRLAAEERLVEDPGRLSNVLFRMPYDAMVAGWRRCLTEVFAPKNLLDRLTYQVWHTYPNRVQVPRKVPASLVAMGLCALGRVLWRVGCRGSYRREFWQCAWPLLRAGKVGEVIQVGLVGHHLILFAEGCTHGAAEACFYADPGRSAFRPGLC